MSELPHRRPCAGCEARSPLTSRRRFLAVVSGGAASAFAQAGCGGASGCDPQAFDAVTVGQADVPPMGVLHAVHGAPVLIGRDERGIYAMTNTCTHNCCTVSATGTGTGILVVCPCHNSHFDGNGAVLQGPAELPLVHFRVDMGVGGTLIVQGGMQVSADTRLVVA
jgi:nitrite reductase/ring-hydroxylating ferredoxin subunit